jgi:uncharacterized integral membrane protein
MLHKLYLFLVVAPIGIILVVFAVANRHPVTVSLDPFGGDAPAWTASVPLFLLVLLLLGVGVLIGGFATWWNQGKWRRAARDLASDTHALRLERDALKAELSAREFPALAPPRQAL